MTHRSPFRSRKGRILATLLVAALAVNAFSAASWALGYSPLSPRVTLVLWAVSNVAILSVAVLASLREGLILRITIEPVPKYLKENPGSPFILTFILSLLLAAATYSSNSTFANDLVTVTFLLLTMGVALQVIALAKKGSSEEGQSDKTSLLKTSLMMDRHLSIRVRRKPLLIAISLPVIMASSLLVAQLIFVQPQK